jgi:hypothetical protein
MEAGLALISFIFGQNLDLTWWVRWRENVNGTELRPTNKQLQQLLWHVKSEQLAPAELSCGFLTTFSSRLGKTMIGTRMQDCNCADMYQVTQR